MRISNRNSLGKDFSFIDGMYGVVTPSVVKSIIATDMAETELHSYFWLMNKMGKEYFYEGSKNSNDYYSLAYDYFNLDKNNNDKLGVALTEVCENMISAYYMRLRRIRSFVGKMFSISMVDSFRSPYFLTIKFTDDVLDSTSDVTRKKYVSNWLNDFDGHYCANKDFGSQTNREHYHAILLTYQADEVFRNGKNRYHWEFNPWTKGHLDVQKINLDSSDLERTTHYLDKVSFHSLKESTSCSRIMYSRKDIDKDIESMNLMKNGVSYIYRL